MATCAHSLNKLQRFQRAVHAGASGFELVNPAGRWASVSSSRVRPSQRENSERDATVTRAHAPVTPVTARNGDVTVTR
jgi:hypothetical protein